MKKSIVFILFLVHFLPVSATNQVKDLLIYNTDTFELEDSPLNSFSEQIKQYAGIEAYASNCWRGYRAVWKIQDSSLYLVKVFYCGSKQEIEGIGSVLNKKFENGMMMADWVNGSLTGERRQSIYLNHDKHLKYIDISVSNGKVKTLQLHNLPIEFGIYKTLTGFFYTKLNWQMIIHETGNQLTSVTIHLKTDASSGKITSVNIIRGFSKKVDKEILRVGKQMPFIFHTCCSGGASIVDFFFELELLNSQRPVYDLRMTKNH